MTTDDPRPPGRVRPAVDGLPAYRPGKGAAQAEAEHGITNAIKLASNENPLPPVASILTAVAAAARRRQPLRRPSGDGGARDGSASWLGVDVDADHGRRWFGRVCSSSCSSPTSIPATRSSTRGVRSRSTRCTRSLMNGTAVTVPLTSDHAFDLDARRRRRDAADEARAARHAEQPDGHGAAHVRDRRTADVDLAEATIVVIDEAYREFLDPSFGDPVRELVPDHPNVVVTRTFSKAQGLAGIRIGYAVGHPDVIAAVDKTLFPFAVNAHRPGGRHRRDRRRSRDRCTGGGDPRRACTRRGRAHRRRLEAPRHAGQLRLPPDRDAHRRGRTSSSNAAAW